MMRRRWVRLAAGMLVALAGAVAVAWLAIVAPRTPRAMREWTPEHARLARAEFMGDTLVNVRDVRNFTYTSATTFRQAYFDHAYDLRRLETVWFVLTPFSATWRGPAHAFVSFGFGDGQYLAISVETRREVGETYGLMTGMLRNFEVAYILGSERDLIGRRALFDGDDVFVYPIASPIERTRQMFVEMLHRANAVQDVPEFYNTLTNNCTSNLVDHVNRMIPGRIPSGLRTILPGYADELALSLGLIEAHGTLDDVRARFRVNQRARAAFDGDNFSAAIRAAVPGGRVSSRDAATQR